MYRRKLLQGACREGTISLVGCGGLLGRTGSVDEAERVDDKSESAPPPEEIATGPVVPSVAASAWGNGDEIAVAVDDIDVSHG